MMRPKVFARRCRPTKKSYRAAVKQIVARLQAEHDLNDPELAERLGCSAPTIANARLERTNLDGVTMANIEYEFGPAALDPFLELGGSRAVPLSETDEGDARATLALASALTALIEAQSPESPGGLAVKREELVPNLTLLRRARGTLDALIELAEGNRPRAVA